MTNNYDTALKQELEKNEQFCIALKTLINIGSDKEVVEDLLERLCDRAEKLHLTFG